MSKNIADLDDIYNLAAWHIYNKLLELPFYLHTPVEIRKCLSDVFGNGTKNKNIKKNLIKYFHELKTYDKEQKKIRKHAKKIFSVSDF